MSKNFDGLKEGDFVKLVRKPSREELDGWIEDKWMSGMDKFVNSVGRVEYFKGEQTVFVCFERDDEFQYGYPVFSLEKVSGRWHKNKGVER